MDARLNALRQSYTGSLAGFVTANLPIHLAGRVPAGFTIRPLFLAG